MLRADGVSVGRTTAITSLLVLPWALKFLAAPLVDCWRGPRWGWRAWIATMQFGMALSLAPLAWFDWVEHLDTLATLLFVHALFAALQDVSIDGAAVRAVHATDRGRVNAAMQFGLVLGRALFGGGALWLVASVGREAVVAAMIGCILATLIATLRLRVADDRATSATHFLHVLLRAARRRSTYYGLAFALFGGTCFEAAGALAGQLLIDRGLTEAEVGTFYATAVIAATIVGGLVGGWTADRWGRRAAIGVWLGGCTATVAALALLDATWSGPNLSGQTLQIPLSAMYFFYGAFTAASYAWFMDLTDRELGATQFSLFMSATNGCESWSTWAAGAVKQRAGYAAAIAAGSAVSLAVLAAFAVFSRRARSDDAGDESAVSPSD